MRYNIIYHLALFLISLSACNWLPKDHKEQATVNPLDALRIKADKVLALSKQNLDPNTGWPLDVSCDGLTFTSLYALAGGSSDIFKAEDQDMPGRYFRDALHKCGTDNGSSATTQSQDAFIMMATLIWKLNDLHHVKEIVDYLKANDLYVGVPHNDITLMSSAVFNTYTIMLAKLQDMPSPPVVDNPDPNLSAPALAMTSLITGFRAHLLVMHIYDRGKIYGAINDIEYQLLKSQAERQPRNTLFSAIYKKFTNGDQSAGIADLMDESRWPSDKQCSTDERCVPYLWSTDDDPSDWAACPAKNQKFTCIDWLVASKIILGDM